MKIHSDDCRGFEWGLVLDDCEDGEGDIRALHRHLCDCHAQQALDELVAAAQEAYYYQESTDSHDRLQAALKPFLERSEK